jgi:ATP-dependent RNA circularization protein (DNA/RNA ligase family)
MTPPKPLNGKAYGSIPHLPGSKYGNRDDKGVTPDAAVHFLSKQKDPRDRVIVTEKLDGTCVAVAKLDGGEVVPLIRAGYPAVSSDWLQHRIFYAWAMERYKWFDKLLMPGERVCGEWLAQAHGTRYDLKHLSPFAAFDIIRNGERICYDDMLARCWEVGLHTVPLIHAGGPISVEAVMDKLGIHGLYRAIDDAEGAVWRIERDGRFLNIAKYVRPSAQVGRYLEGPEVWNWRPEVVA